jgi:hypothetical protein
MVMPKAVKLYFSSNIKILQTTIKTGSAFLKGKNYLAILRIGNFFLLSVSWSHLPWPPFPQQWKPFF